MFCPLEKKYLVQRLYFGFIIFNENDIVRSLRDTKSDNGKEIKFELKEIAPFKLNFKSKLNLLQKF